MPQQRLKFVIGPDRKSGTRKHTGKKAIVFRLDGGQWSEIARHRKLSTLKHLSRLLRSEYHLPTDVQIPNKGEFECMGEC